MVESAVSSKTYFFELLQEFFTKFDSDHLQKMPVFKSFLIDQTALK